MTAAARVLERLAAVGWRATADGARLVIEPDRLDAPDLTEVQRRWLADHKTAMLAHLTRRCCETCCWFEPALPTFFQQQAPDSPDSPDSPAEQTATPTCWLCAYPVPLRDPDRFECGAWSAQYTPADGGRRHRDAG